MTTTLQHHNSAVPSAFEQIIHALKGLAFGTVEITIHHGRIVQIERREKLRVTEVAPTSSADPLTVDRRASQT